MINEKDEIYSISYVKFFILTWGPLIFFSSVGLFNKGLYFFDLENLKNTRIFGSNIYLLLFILIIYLYILVKQSIVVILSKKYYLYVYNSCLYKHHKVISSLNNIDIDKSHFKRKYFAEFIHIEFKIGNSVDIPLIYANLQNQYLLSKIVKMELQ